MYRIEELEDNTTGQIIVEDYNNEAEELFNKADKEAEDLVQILFTNDSFTGEEIILHREDWVYDH